MNRHIIEIRKGFLGIFPIANFDGNYYLYIAQFGYHGLDQSFFPFFPLVIHAGMYLGFDPLSAALFVVAFSLFGFLYTFCKLIQIDYSGNSYIWVLLFTLSFPTSFFFATIYTESLFLFLTIMSFYLARKEKMLFASFFAGLASATRIIGIFLLPALALEIYQQNKKKISFQKYIPLCFIPLGLLVYMSYLWVRYSDPLLFIHLQPLFGAGRSGGIIILLPQVLFRYFKILFMSSFNLTYWISVTELIVFFFVLTILFLAYKKGMRKSYILFSACAILFPTLSGTLSSMPRYALASFVVFIYLGLLKNRALKLALVVIGLMIEALFATLFFQGYFIS